jgi:hypothetical protein
MSLNGVLQLEKLSLRFCKASGASAGARAIVRDEIERFATETSSARIAAKVVPARAPRLIAEYRDGSSKEIDVKNRSPEEILTVMRRLRDLATAKRRSFRKPVQTHTPTVQGLWDASITYEGFELRETTRPAN